jgi:hypothetical protein
MKRPDRSRWILVAAACALAACQTIDQKKLETGILDDTTNQGIKLASVSCPSGMPLREGTRFDCSCVDARGTTGSFSVWVANGHGRVEWKLRNKYMNMRILGDSLEARISKRLGKVVDVKCPSDNVLVKTGVSLSCDVQIGAKDDRLTLVAKNDEGTDWSEQFVEQPPAP